jgi:hypothetical protein
MDTHELIRPGSSVDLYYYDAETSKKQAFPTTYNTRYIQNFQNLTGGSQTFTFPPTNGLTDVILSMAYTGVGSPGAIALPRAWGYALINRVSFRYGGSSQYFLTGDQLLQLALRAQPSQSAGDSILTLGGNVATGSALVGVQQAFVVLTLPHSWPSGVGKKNPFPSDLLTQQVQITVELNPPNSIWTNQTGAALPAFCSTLTAGSFQVAQLMLNNQGDCLARRHDMSVSAYAFPAEFTQQVVRVPVTGNNTNPQQVTLTGFRAGGLKAIQFWLTRSADTSSLTTGYNPFRWYLPSSLQVTYAGQVYSRFENGSSSLWGLLNGSKQTANNNTVVAGGGSAITTSSELMTWVDAPFAQPLVDEDAHNILINGMPITNGIINVDITTPSAQTDWVLNCSYIYNTTILFSQGTCDLVF